MSRPWSDIDPDEEKLLANWNQDASSSHTGCSSPEMIRAYLEECLPEPELAGVKLHIATCAACAALSRDLKALDVSGPAPLEVGRIRARIGLPVQALPQPKASAAWWRPLAPWVLAAASAALVIGTWIQIGKKPRSLAENPPLVTKKTAPIPNPIPVRPAAVRLPLASLVWRGDENKVADAYPASLSKALESYREGNYGASVSALEEVTAKYPRRPEAQFYLGVSLLLVGRAADAIAHLENVRTAGESSVSPEIGWYLAAALENAGRKQEAEPLFRSLCNASGIHQKEACSALTAR